jgi:hypothetical protein
MNTTVVSLRNSIALSNLQIEMPSLCETNRISTGGNLTLYTSVVVPGGLPRAIPVSAMPKSIQKDKTKQIEYNIYLLQ